MNYITYIICVRDIRDIRDIREIRDIRDICDICDTCDIRDTHTPVTHNYVHIGLGQTHPALLLMRQRFQSFKHLLKVDPQF